MSKSDDALIAAALGAMGQAYAPYSQFQVGAALSDEAGTIHIGVNVENAAYPQGSCAEAGAIAAMIINGGRKITAVAVAGRGDALCTPCGGCRQRLREFAGPDTPIIICGEDGERARFTLAQLLPHSFGPDNLSNR
ncbi:MAG: cytidine deaminase [Candidatus Puniceispirillaceae bacterium]